MYYKSYSSTDLWGFCLNEKILQKVWNVFLTKFGSPQTAQNLRRFFIMKVFEFTFKPRKNDAIFQMIDQIKISRVLL